MTERNLTWEELLVFRPDLTHFIETMSQKYGGLPEGPIDVVEFLRLMDEYVEMTR